eukprot:COSAG02_NODE_2371_length_9032_cov_26.076122_4_plen_352_part_00
MIPGVGGWPELDCSHYTLLVRTHVLEMLLLSAAVAWPGGHAAVLLGMALCVYLLQFGQRMAQMFGMVSGSKDCLAAWSLLLLLCAEVDGSGAGPRSMRLLMAAAYGVPGITKFLFPLRAGHGLFAWLDGRTLQCILLERTVLYDNQLAKVVAAFPTVAVGGSIAAVLFENLFLALPFASEALALPLAMAGLSFHLGCAALLGINFLPLWLPTYSCLLPVCCSALTPWLWSSAHTCAEAGFGDPNDDEVAFGTATCFALILLGLGALWHYYEILVKRVPTEGRLWPMTVLTPYYSGYCTGYEPRSNGNVEIKAVTIDVLRADLKISNEGMEAVWLPPLDGTLASTSNRQQSH